MSASMEARFWFSPSRGRLTWREPSEAIYPLTAPNDWRPLVVIDAEDREQVDRLMSLLADALNWGPHNLQRESYREPLQSALREFANPTPPKPDEPTGLGAVVEDARGRKWTRYDTKGDSQPWWCDDQGPEVPVERRYSYANITAVRVLSEGVQP